jgi:PAS domain S-box-containing protein
MKIRTKLILGFSSINLLVLLAAVLITNTYNTIDTNLNSLTGGIVPAVLRTSGMGTEAETAYRAAKEYAITGDTGSKDNAMAALNRLYGLDNQQIEYASSRSEADLQDTRTLTGKMDLFIMAIADFISQKDLPADRATLENTENQQVIPALSDFVKLAQRQEAILMGEMTRDTAAFQSTRIFGMKLLLAFAMMSVVVAIAVTFLITRSIVKPLDALRHGTEIIGAGNLDHTVGTDARDEIGQLSRAFDKMTGDLKGTMTSVDTLNREIAERKQAEGKLRESEEKYRAVFEQASDSIVLIDFEGGKMLDFNDQAHQALGYTREEFDKLTLRDIDAFPNTEALLMRKDNILEKGTNTFEEKHRAKNGEIRDTYVSAKTVHIGGKTLALNIWQDITERKRAEEKLRENEEKYRAVFEQASDSIALTDLETSEIVDFNDQAFRNLGYTREEFAKLNLTDIDASPESKKVEKGREILLNKDSNVAEAKHRTKSGEIRDIYLSAKTVRIGGRTLVANIWHDITEKKRAEEKLRESEEFSSGLLQHAPNPIIAINPDTSIKFTNPAFEKLTGFTQDEVIGRKSPFPWWPEETGEARHDDLQEAMAGTSTRIERICRKKNGELLWVVLNAAPIMQNGTLQYLLVNWVDITGRKQAEEKLQESEEFSSSLRRSSAVPILVINEDTSIRYVNPAMEKLSGFTDQELIGKKTPYPWWIESEATSGNASELEKDIFTGVSGLEKRFRKKSGEQFWVEITSAPVKRDGTFLYCLENWLNITRRKQAEEKLLEIDKMKSEFLSNVSHELRTPLQSIGGFTKLLLRGQVPDKATQQEFMEIIDRESQYLGNLINSLLDMSRLESGRFEINKRFGPIRDTIVEAVSIFKGLVHDKEITLKQEIPDDLPEIDADSGRLRQVIINLVGNAVKFSDPGGEVTVRAERRSQEMLFQVSDHGIGIPAESMPHLFERFYRAEDKMVRGGAGLGLFISKQIIEAHGGRIWADSQPGKGSTFSFILPLNGKGENAHG